MRYQPIESQRRRTQGREWLEDMWMGMGMGWGWVGVESLQKELGRAVLPMGQASQTNHLSLYSSHTSHLTPLISHYSCHRTRVTPKWSRIHFQKTINPCSCVMQQALWWQEARFAMGRAWVTPSFEIRADLLTPSRRKSRRSTNPKPRYSISTSHEVKYWICKHVCMHICLCVHMCM